MTTLAPTLQAFFTNRLAQQRQASPHTVAAYRDTALLAAPTAPGGSVVATALSSWWLHRLACASPS